MPDKKLTDNEIIKAWKVIKENNGMRLQRIPTEYLINETLNLINRQKAEVEDLKFLYENLKEEHLEIIKAIKHTKAEAYKEFAERLKELPYIPNRLNLHKAYDNLLKEMVGEDK